MEAKGIDRNVEEDKNQMESWNDIGENSLWLGLMVEEKQRQRDDSKNATRRTNQKVHMDIEPPLVFYKHE